MYISCSIRRFSKAIQLINHVDEDCLIKILPRFCDKLCVKEGRAFSADECSKIQSTFNLDVSETELLLETAEFIFQQVNTELLMSVYVPIQILILCLYYLIIPFIFYD